MRGYLRFLMSVINENAPESRKGLVLVIAIHALTFVLCTLTIAGLFGMTIPDAFNATVWGIVALASIVYGVGKFAERDSTKETEKDDAP